MRGKACGQLAAGHRCGAAQGTDRSRGGPAATAAVERAGSWRVVATMGTRGASTSALGPGRHRRRGVREQLVAAGGVRRPPCKRPSSSAPPARFLVSYAKPSRCTKYTLMGPLHLLAALLSSRGKINWFVTAAVGCRLPPPPWSAWTADSHHGSCGVLGPPPWST